MGSVLNTARWPDVLLVAQVWAGARLAHRLLATSRGSRISIADSSDVPDRISVVVPVLDEEDRLGPCLAGLIAQGRDVLEILVVDGGSSDRTSDVVAAYGRLDRRIRFLDASPIPPDWNGKAWGLHRGSSDASPVTAWLLTVDADVRVEPGLARSLLVKARQGGLASLSVATLQVLGDWGSGLVHPAMLATLVYRRGSPGNVARRVQDAQANGQCALYRRDALAARGGFAAAKASRCEDVTIARRLVSHGLPVGFYETDGLVSVKMYKDWREAWQNWPRSLTLRDRFAASAAFVGLLEVTLMQALPLPLTLWLLMRPGRTALFWVNVILTTVRFGILIGLVRAYVRPPWSYWLSPLCDGAVVARLWASLLQRRQIWRGRTMVVEGTS